MSDKLKDAIDRCQPILGPGWVDVENASPELVADLLIIARAYAEDTGLNQPPPPQPPDLMSPCLCCERTLKHEGDFKDVIYGGGWMDVRFGYGSIHDTGPRGFDGPVGRFKGSTHVTAYICDGCYAGRQQLMRGSQTASDDPTSRTVFQLLTVHPILSDAYLPVTEAWLRAVGVEEKAFGRDGRGDPIMDLWVGPARWYNFANGGELLVDFGPGSVGGWRLRTRGDARNFAKSLGITLAPTPEGFDG